MGVSTRDMQHYRVPDDAHHELQNWARWCWTGDWPHPGMVVFAEDEDETRLPPPNERRAKVANLVWDQMVGHPRLVLRAEYPQRAGQTRQFHATKLGLTLQEYEAALRYAVGKVQEAFDAVCA